MSLDTSSRRTGSTLAYHAAVELRVRHRSVGQITAEAGPTVLRVVNGVATTPESLDLLLGCFDELLARLPVAAMLVIVEHGSPQPSAAIRQRIDAELRRYGERIVLGYAFLGLGFWNVDSQEFVAERTATVGTPLIVTNTIPELVRRVASELIGLDPGLLEGAIERLRAELSG